MRMCNLSGRSGQVPAMDQLLNEGRAAKKRIDELERGNRRIRKMCDRMAESG